MKRYVSQYGKNLCTRKLHIFEMPPLHRKKSRVILHIWTELITMTALYWDGDYVKYQNSV